RVTLQTRLPSHLVAFAFLVVGCATRTPTPMTSTQPSTPRREASIVPNDFVSLSDVDSTIQLDMRYQTSDNFVGRPIAGYRAPKCLLTNEAAAALARAQLKANAQGYALKVYDCYRPRRAVADFIEWAADVRDKKMQPQFYPAVPKSELFARG